MLCNKIYRCVETFVSVILFNSFPTVSLHKKAAIHQVTTMLAASKNVIFPGAGARVITKVSGHQYWWLADGYDLEIRHF